jgi:integrase
VEIRVRGHRPIYNTFHSKTEASRWAKSVEDDLKKGRLTTLIEAEKHTLKDAIVRYNRDHLDALSKDAYRADRSAHLKWWQQRIGHMTLATLSPADISDARQGLLQTVSGATSNRYLAALSAVLNLASGEWGWMERNPAGGVSRKKETRGRVRFLSEDERRRLLAACADDSEPRLYPLVLFALTTGARQGELLGLKWADVDLVNLRAVLHETKNTDRRVIHFPGESGEVLRNLARTVHISGYVFAGPRTKIGIPPKMLLGAWARAVKAAGLEDFRFHDLRHSAASYMAMSGASLPELAAFLGHRTLEMVRRYAHLTEGHQASVVERMAEKFDL